MTAGADAIHTANPDLLIFFSGLSYDSQLRPIFSGDVPIYQQIPFDTAKLAYANKIVLEVHDYDMDSNCTVKKSELTTNAFQALDAKDPQVRTAFPLVMSEWGFQQTVAQYQAAYASCLRDFLPEQKVGWMTWALAGSYYVRQGVPDMDEPWGLLDHEWKQWRCPECVTKGLQTMIRATLGSE